MKQKFLKNSLLLFLIGIIMVSCELQEEAIHQHEHNSNLKLYEMKFEELMTNKRFINSFSKLPKSKKNLTTATVGRTVMENEYGFTIANKPAKVIEDNGETSYTFLITRDATDANSFENLVIQTDSTNTTKAVIIKYNLTSPITSSADDSFSFTYENEITPIVYNNTTVSETSKMVIDCHWIHVLLCINDGYGGIGNEHPANANCQNPHLTYYAVRQVCNSFDDGISSGGGTGPTGSGPTGGSTNTGSNGGSGGTGGANSINTSPVNNCITGNCIEENTTDPCSNSNTAVANANALFNSPQIQQGMNAVLIQKINDEGQLSLLDQKEWGVAIGQTGSTYNVTAPRRGSANQGSIPSSQVTGNYVADGHSHPNWGYADPSAGDLYGMLTSIQTNINLKYRFVYGVAYGNSQDIDTYALIVTDPNAAEAFLTQFPEIQNTNSESHDFMEDTKLGDDYFVAKRLFGRGFSSNLSDETYAPGAVGLAAILDKNNAGICIAKKDANGNFKKINATLVEKTDANGNKTQEVMVSKCQ
jgi:hypothetical protein